MKGPVPRIGRILDLAGLLLFLAGAALYARAWLGLRGMDSFVPDPDSAGFAALARADQLSSLGRVGVGLMIAGGIIGVIAAVVALRIMRRPDASESTPTA